MKWTVMMSISVKKKPTNLKNNNSVEDTRSSSTELLRIIACFMVISLHYIGKGTTLLSVFSEEYKINIYLAFIIEALSICAVNVFFLISGYHGVNSKGLLLRRIIDIMLMSSFYGLLCYIVAIVSGYDSASVAGFYDATFPFLSGKIWYVSVFLVFTFVAQFLNPILKSISKCAFRSLIAISLVILSIIPFFFGEGRTGYDLYQFFLMYLIGVYIRLHVKNRFPLLNLAVYILFSAATALTRAFIGSDYAIGRHVLDYSSIFVIVAAVALSSFVLSFTFQSNLINKIARGTLGIYIMNVFCDMKSELLYYDLIKSKQFQFSKMMLLHFTVSVIGFFIGAFLLDSLRDMIHAKFVAKILDRSKIINTRIIAKYEPQSQKVR